MIISVLQIAQCRGICVWCSAQIFDLNRQHINNTQIGEFKAVVLGTGF